MFFQRIHCCGFIALCKSGIYFAVSTVYTFQVLKFGKGPSQILRTHGTNA